MSDYGDTVMGMTRVL